MKKLCSLVIGIALPLTMVTVASAYDDLTPQQAYDAVVEDGSYILDVRTDSEHVWVGHPYILDEDGVEIEKVVNISYKLENGGSMVINPSFIAQVESLFGASQDIHIITMCRSGGRGAAAAGALEAAGYTNVSNMIEGFEGEEKDKYGYSVRTMNGWKNSHLPGHTSI